MHTKFSDNVASAREKLKDTKKSLERALQHLRRMTKETPTGAELDEALGAVEDASQCLDAALQALTDALDTSIFSFGLVQTDGQCSYHTLSVEYRGQRSWYNVYLDSDRTANDYLDLLRQNCLGVQDMTSDPSTEANMLGALRQLLTQPH